jgi:hypothetical protein
MTSRSPHPVLAASSFAAVLIALASVSAHAGPRARIGLPRGIRPTDTIELADGRKVSAQRVQDELNELQEAIENSGNFSLRKSDAKPFRGKQRQAGQDKEAAEDKAAFAQRVSKLRARAQNGFRDLVRPRGAPKLPSGGVKLSDLSDLSDQERLGPSVSPSPTRAPGGVAPRPPGSQGVLQPTEEPLALEYEEALGKKDKAAIYVAFGLEDRGDANGVGCEGGLEGGVYLFNEKRALAKAVLKGSANATTTTGGLELYLVGKMVDGFPKSGSQSLPELRKSINPPEIAYGYGWNPISIRITAGVAGELGIRLTSTQTRGSGTTKGTCTVGVTPYVRGTGRATASVSAAVFKVGIEGNLTFFDLRLPATATIALQANPLAFREDFEVALDTKYLDGDLGFFVQTNVPRQGEKVWDVDWDTIYRKTFFEWDGFTARETLARFSAKQTPFQ